MTTIVIDTVNKRLYTDSRATETVSKSYRIFSSEKVKNIYDNYIKLWRTKDVYHFYTGTGTVKDIVKFLNTGKHKHLKDSLVWEINSSLGVITEHTRSGGEVLNEDYQYHVQGSGRYCFQTSMNFTKCPKEAINNSADPGTGGKVHEYKIDWSYPYEDVH